MVHWSTVSNTLCQLSLATRCCMRRKDGMKKPRANNNVAKHGIFLKYGMSCPSAKKTATTAISEVPAFVSPSALAPKTSSLGAKPKATGTARASQNSSCKGSSIGRWANHHRAGGLGCCFVAFVDVFTHYSHDRVLEEVKDQGVYWSDACCGNLQQHGWEVFGAFTLNTPQSYD